MKISSLNQPIANLQREIASLESTVCGLGAHNTSINAEALADCAMSINETAMELITSIGMEAKDHVGADFEPDDLKGFADHMSDAFADIRNCIDDINENEAA